MGCFVSQPEKIDQKPVPEIKPEPKPRAKPPRVLHPSVHHTPKQYL
jgi:hypothetical protein